MRTRPPLPQRLSVCIHMKNRDVTRLLDAAGSGDRLAFERLYHAVYGELRRMAAANMRREQRGHTLQPTALVNEVYLRLSGTDGAFKNRRHFFGAASQAMRRILVEHARRRDAKKRGADIERVTLTPDIDAAAEEPPMDVVLLDEALTQLAAERPRMAELVTLRFFAGLSIEDAAQALEISLATAKRDWAFARAWLHEQMRTQGTP